MNENPLESAGQTLRASLKRVARVRAEALQAQESIEKSKLAVDSSKRLLLHADKLISDWQPAEEVA